MSILKEISRKKSDMLPTNLIMISFCGTVVQLLGVLSIELTVRHRMAKIVFFIITAATMYNALLG